MTMVMTMESPMVMTLSKAQFKPKVLAWLRQVEETGEELIITDHGRPAVRIVPAVSATNLAAVQETWARKVAAGQVRYNAADADEAVAPLPADAWGELNGPA